MCVCNATMHLCVEKYAPRMQYRKCQCVHILRRAAILPRLQVGYTQRYMYPACSRGKMVARLRHIYMKYRRITCVCASCACPTFPGLSLFVYCYIQAGMIGFITLEPKCAIPDDNAIYICVSLFSMDGYGY
jgi:hypothetical protein